MPGRVRLRLIEVEGISAGRCGGPGHRDDTRITGQQRGAADPHQKAENDRPPGKPALAAKPLDEGRWLTGGSHGRQAPSARSMMRATSRRSARPRHSATGRRSSLKRSQSVRSRGERSTRSSLAQ